MFSFILILLGVYLGVISVLFIFSVIVETLENDPRPPVKPDRKTKLMDVLKAILVFLVPPVALIMVSIVAVGFMGAM